jgi:Tfp pilus assembly protein PilN
MSNNLPSINLVKDRQLPLFDKFMNWVLTAGRLIVIVTEIVAVVAFIYRFSLDEKLVNLHSAIKQKQNIVSRLKNDESKYRNLQDRIALAASFSEKGAKTSQAITDIINLIPNGTIVNNITINKDKVSININTASISSLSDFINALKSYNGIKSISIDNIENRPSIGLSVSITTMLK